MFTWKPGATTDTSRALFGTWLELLAAAKAITPSSIAFEQTGDPFHIGPKPGGGAWDVDGVAFDGGAQLGVGPVLYFDDGAQLTGLGKMSNVTLVSLSSIPVIEAEDGSQITLDEASQLRCDGGLAPFIHVADTVSLYGVNLRYFSSLYSSDLSVPVIYAEAGSFVGIATDMATAIYDNTLDGAGAYLVDDLTTRVEAQRNTGISHTQNAPNITYSYG